MRTATNVFGFFSLEETEVALKSLKLQRGKKIEAANLFSRKRGAEGNQVLQQLNQPNISIQNVNNNMEIIQMTPPTSKN